MFIEWNILSLVCCISVLNPFEFIADCLIKIDVPAKKNKTKLFSFFSTLAAAVEEVKLKDTQYTLEHMRAFGMYNYLHLDPWYEDSVLFVDCKGRVLNLTVTLVCS